MKTLIASLLVVSAIAVPLHAAEYYVAPNGNDRNSGNKASPFQTLEHAAEKMEPGNTCWLREGRYRFEERLSGIKGKSGAPLLFKAFPGERAVLDGTEPLPSEWKPGKDKIYRLKTRQPVWQLFIGEKLVYTARWPNASFEDGSMWKMEACMRFTDRKFKKGAYLGKTTDGIIFDRNPESHEGDSADEGAVKLHALEGVNQTTLAETGVDFTGAIGVLNLGHWLTWARPITDHEAGRDWFGYDNAGTKMSKYVAYYILGLPALDRPNEWWYDNDSGTAYLRAPQDADPNKLPMSGKVRDFNLRLKDCSHLVFQGLEFFGTTFSMQECDHVVIEDCRLLYPSTVKFMLGDFEWFKTGGTDASKKKYGKTDNVTTHILNSGEEKYENVVRNCEIAYPNSPAINIRSPGSIIENCHIHDIEWDLNSNGGSGSLPTGNGVTIRRNTIHSAGNSEGIRPGAHSLVEYNRLWNMGNLQHDGSAINVGTAAQLGTLVRYNWVHDSNRQGIRFDSTTTAMGGEGCVHNNVVFNLGTGGSKFKGDHHLIFNNTCYNSFLAIPTKYGNTPPNNRNTLTCNNLADFLVAWSLKRPDEEIFAAIENTVSGEGSALNQLRDPGNLDFRPKPESKLIGAGRTITTADLPTKNIRVDMPPYVGNAPDIGAYEAGSARYWIPGRQIEKASSPIPPDGATNVKKDASLMFLEAYKTDRHKVMFTNKTKNHTGSQELVETNIHTPGQLRSGQTYYWRVDAVKEDGAIVKGDLWSFTVAK